MPPLDNTLTADEMKFFETGELQPSMAPPPEPPAPAPVAAAPVEPPAVEPPAPMPPAPSPHNAETAEILRQSLEAAHTRVGELQAQLESLAKPPAPAASPAPDPETDPLGHLLHKIDTMSKALGEMQSQIADQREHQTQLTQFQQFQQQVNTLRDEFAKTHTDFGDAYNHLRSARVADLKMYGYTPQDIQKTLLQEEVALSQNAIKLGKNPAEAVYDMAKRHGYVPKGAPPPAAPVPPNDKLTAIQQGQRSSQQLPSTPQLEDITVEGLKGASDADLTKLVNDPNMWAKITGADSYPL
jgi:hypothetical protein